MDLEAMVGVWADLDGNVKRIHDRLDRRRPVHKPVGGSVTVPTGFSLPLLINLSGWPSVNRVWNVLTLGFYTGDLHTTIANVTCDVYAGTNPDPSVPTLTDGIASMALGSIQNFSKEVVWAEPGQSLFGLVYGTGVAAGANYQLIARVGEYWIDAVEARSL